MKKQILFFSTIALLFVGTTTLVSCGGDENNEGTEQISSEGTDEATAKQYHCPMKCDDDKKYDAPGECASCGMTLEEVEG